MVRVLHTCGVIVLILAGVGSYLTTRCWSEPDPNVERVLQHPSAIDRSSEAIVQSDDATTRNGPLILQAEAFSSYLQPVVPDKKGELPAPALEEQANNDPVLPVRPVATAAKFTLRATSFYPSQPHRSIALVAEVGSANGSERWVKEGSQVGHFVIHEIRQGAVVYRDGDQLREMTVDVAAAPRSLVRDIRPGSRTASAAVEGAGIALPIPAGPNSVSLGRD
jgi:hypothetical protein